MFAFGDKQWPGVAKIVEETGELGQVIGRLMMMHGQPLTGPAPTLRCDFIDEAADVKAAIRFFEMKGLTEAEADRLNRRADDKLLQFLVWHREQAQPEETKPVNPMVGPAIEKYGQPDARGHVTRYSDSSLYDIRCVLCGATDAIHGGKLNKIDCPQNPPTVMDCASKFDNRLNFGRTEA